jgi:hypothetical protein
MAAMVFAVVSFARSINAPRKNSSVMWTSVLLIAVFAVLAGRAVNCAHGDCSRRAAWPPESGLIIFALGAHLFFLLERLAARRRLLVEELPWMLAQLLSSVILFVYVFVQPR